MDKPLSEMFRVSGADTAIILENGSPSAMDLASARLFVSKFSGKLGYCHKSASWLCNRGGTWCRLDDGEINNFGDKLADQLLTHATALVAAEPNAANRAIRKFALRLQRPAVRNAMLRLARCAPEIALMRTESWARTADTAESGDDLV